MVAIADQAAGRDLGLLNPTCMNGDGPRSGLTDITAGNNSVSGVNAGPDFPGPFNVIGFNAVPGYDLASGLGTPNGVKLVSELAGLHQGFTLTLTS